MHVQYTISNTTKLEIFLKNNMFSITTCDEFINVSPIYNGKYGKSCIKKVKTDNEGLYIVWNRTKVYLKNFDYNSVAIMSQKIEQYAKEHLSYISDDEIYATFFRDTDNVGLVVNMPIYETIFSQLDIKYTGDKVCKVLCVPTEREYSKDNWGYKITLECENKEYHSLIPSHNFYFSDLCTLLKLGNIKLVDKNSFKKIILEENKKRKIEEKKISYKIKSFFNANDSSKEYIIV
jgi:hypothetical protein